MVGCSRLVVLAAVAVLKEAKAVAADWVEVGAGLVVTAVTADLVVGTVAQGLEAVEAVEMVVADLAAVEDLGADLGAAGWVVVDLVAVGWVVAGLVVAVMGLEALGAVESCAQLRHTSIQCRSRNQPCGCIEQQTPNRCTECQSVHRSYAT